MSSLKGISATIYKSGIPILHGFIHLEESSLLEMSVFFQGVIVSDNTIIDMNELNFGDKALSVDNPLRQIGYILGILLTSPNKEIIAPPAKDKNTGEDCFLDVIEEY